MSVRHEYREFVELGSSVVQRVLTTVDVCPCHEFEELQWPTHECERLMFRCTRCGDERDVLPHEIRAIEKRVRHDSRPSGMSQSHWRKISRERFRWLS